MNKSSKFTSIVGAVLCIVSGFMLICNLTIIVKGTLTPEKPPSVLGVTPMVVLSGSMSGTAEDHIEVGDLIFVGKADPDELKAGDVIAFMDGKVVVTHRILEVQAREDGALQYITKGDANNSTDLRPVHEDNLVGIYKARIPKLGDFALFLQTPLGMVLFIALPLMAFILYDILRRQMYAKQEAKRTDELEAELARLRKLAGENQSEKSE
ncbi:MAG: signal peptidase I [Peptococcaceae bacterium]|nr:signal peptidase I [Peptococcaceae bacterium]